jgi:probable F420-dependent oxidoreductase
MTEMAHHPFRFGVIAEQMKTRSEWLGMARRVEGLGYSTLLIRDHFGSDFFGDQFAPFAALMAAASATTTLRVGTMVIDNDFRHPVVLAKEIATLDLLSDGRVDLGLGAGWLRSEYDMAGIAFDRAGTRIERLEESIQVLNALFADSPASFTGKHYTVTDLNGYPKPQQRPRPPIMIGGAGQRILALAAREADIIHFLPSTIATGTLIATPRDRLPDVLANRISWVREQAGDRFQDIVLSPSAEFVVTSDRGSATEQFIAYCGWHDVTVDEVGQMPGIFIGTVDEIIAAVIRRREQFGFSYFIVPSANIEQCAPIVARLAGR